jgi:hypothetical protein
MTKIYPASRPSKIRESLKAPKHLVLFGRPHDIRKKGPRFTVKVYDSRNPDIMEAIEQEQPYRHYLGVYTDAITTDELREDIQEMIRDKYGVVA